MDSPARRIAKMKQASSWRTNYMIPIGDLREMWTNDELQKVVPEPLTNTEIRFAQEHLLRTISLLVYLEVPDAGQIILGLIKSNKRFDDDLHVVEANDVNLSLDETGVNYFLDVRPFFTRPVLTEGEDMTLKGAQELPLIGSRESLGHGMNGVVTGYTIPRGHLKRRERGFIKPNSQGILVAVKTFQAKVSEQEIRILKKLRDLLHNKEIQICVCFSVVTEHSEVHSLSLRATSNLKDKLTKLQSSGGTGEFDRDRFMECIKQIKGIVEAVEFLHNNESGGPNTFYCHMDIKPENILVFESDPSFLVGKWQLIDFGITTISEKKRSWTDGGAREEGTHQHITITVGTTARALASRYQPPEINSNITRLERGESGTYMGRGSDVWSLACVFAEVVAANLGELSYLQNKLKDCFYEKSQMARICPLLPGVSKWKRHHSFNNWLKKLRERGESEPDLKICQDLIVRMTHIHRIRRLKSQQVLGKFSELSG
ncbi:kinase-like domain-containing protein [Xylaria flabelliformis]|nr:kinase-like domain-containing protein [Xylaria flabelliformis]